MTLTAQAYCAKCASLAESLERNAELLAEEAPLELIDNLRSAERVVRKLATEANALDKEVFGFIRETFPLSAIIAEGVLKDALELNSEMNAEIEQLEMCNAL